MPTENPRPDDVIWFVSPDGRFAMCADRAQLVQDIDPTPAVVLRDREQHPDPFASFAGSPR